jgi:hypothetical protein
MGITPLRILLEEANEATTMVSADSLMKRGDIIVMPGGLVHKGRGDPGKTKIYYSFHPRGIKGYDKYKHEEQIDGLEVWVILCSQIWKQLKVQDRQKVFSHIITAFLIALCSQFQFYTRYDGRGLLFYHFRLLDDRFWKEYGRSRKNRKQSWKLGLVYEGNRLPKDPRLLFEKLPKDEYGYDRYKFTRQAVEVW